MRQMVSIIGLAFTICSLALGQSSSNSKSTSHLEQKLMQLERDWSAAYLKHDTATVNRILGDDYVGTDGRGVMTDKAQEIADARGPKPGDHEPDFLILEDTVTDMKVRRYGNVGVVTGRSIEKVKSLGLRPLT